MKALEVFLYPHLAEKSIGMVEKDNRLVFVVKRESDKAAIKDAVEKGFEVKVLSVNTSIDSKGRKRAFVKLDKKHSAADIASRLGMI